MPLKITLKPGERIFIGGAVLRNGPSRSQFFVENQTPLLREKEILLEEEVDSVAKEIYFLVQAMYMEGTISKKYAQTFSKLIGQFIRAAPSSAQTAVQVSAFVLSGQLYKALKACRKLIELEDERLNAFQERWQVIDGDQAKGTG